MVHLWKRVIHLCVKVQTSMFSFDINFPVFGKQGTITIFVLVKYLSSIMSPQLPGWRWFSKVRVSSKVKYGNGTRDSCCVLRKRQQRNKTIINGIRTGR
jgi:hypothetical protein